jgi:hypothetical protein
MPRRVQGPDGITHEFPDDATDEEISEALSTPPSSARGKPERTWTDTAVDALPTLGGAAGGILGGLGGAAFGLGFGGVPGAVGGATLGGAAGEAFKQLINRARGADAPETMTDAATDIGVQGGVQGALEATGQAIPKALASGGRAIYRGYLKPSLAKGSVGKADAIVETAIREGLPVTAAGGAKAQKLIGELKAEVESLLGKAPGTVDLHQIAERVRAFGRQKYYKPGVDSADYHAVLKVADNIDAHPSLGLPPGAKPSRVAVSLPTANEAKRGLDTAVGEANFGVERGATKTAQKFGRRALRNDLEKAAPEIAPLNARESRLIDAAKAIERAVGRESNKSPLIGVNTMLSGALGAGAYAGGGDPFTAAALALVTRAGLDPAIGSRVGIVAARLGKTSGAVPATAARVALQAVLEAQQRGDEPDD